MAKSKKNKNSVFTGQKPKKHLRKFLKNFKIIAAILMIGALCVGGWFGINLLKSNIFDHFNFTKQTNTTKWDVEFAETKGFKSLTDAQKKQILKTTHQKLNEASHKELSNVATNIQNYLSAQSVHIMRTGVQQVLLAIELYEPLLLITTKNTIRYLTEDGNIYGKALTQSTDHETMSVVNGIFDDKKTPFTLTEHMTLETTDEEQKLVFEAIELFKESKNLNYKVKKIQYINQRGFSIILDEPHTNVVIGHAPFNDKLKSLNKILKEYKNKGSQALKIELDYNNKAFIKETSPSRDKML